MKCDELIELGFIYRNPTTKLASGTVVMPKPAPQEFLFTGDRRSVNVQTKKNQWPMPHPDAMLSKLSATKTFSLLDFIRGYW